MDTHRLTLTLDRRGAEYRGNGTATFLECFYKDVRGPITIDLHVMRAASIGGVWRATRIKGSYVHTTPAATSSVYPCPASRVTASISGSLEDR